MPLLLDALESLMPLFVGAMLVFTAGGLGATLAGATLLLLLWGGRSSCTWAGITWWSAPPTGTKRTGESLFFASVFPLGLFAVGAGLLLFIGPYWRELYAASHPPQPSTGRNFYPAPERQWLSFDSSAWDAAPPPVGLPTDTSAPAPAQGQYEWDAPPPPPPKPEHGRYHW